MDTEDKSSDFIEEAETETEPYGSLSSFFREKETVLQLIQQLFSDPPSTLDHDALVSSVSIYLVPYQEQPQLLGPHINDLMAPLCSKLIELAMKKVLDPDTSTDMSTKQDEDVLHTICKLIQLICRVRGYKHVVKYFPHEVNHLEVCIKLLNLQDQNDYEKWETRYVLLLWLSILCLIPFEICSMDSKTWSKNPKPTENHKPTENKENDDNDSSLIHEIIKISKSYISDSGPTREAAALCISSLLTRPDMENDYLKEYITWAVKNLNDLNSNEIQLHTNSFLFLGILQSIVQIFKKGHRGKLLQYAGLVLQPCLGLADEAKLTLTRKLLTKLFHRIGMIFLPPRVASWRYQRGQRSLQVGIHNLLPSTSSLTASTSVLNQEEEEEEVEIVEEMEDIIEKTLSALSDRDTVVRWSAAKGIGRITMRLPKEYGNDVVGAVIELFSEDDADCQWHGGCLALAELARRGLLLPQRLEEVIPLVERAMCFDVLKGQHSIGSHVRDAASYVCWAFARAYSPLIMKPFVRTISQAMLITSLYDREINCRRAGAAAYQEMVGRQGAENFPNGIEIITIVDYFSIGNRIACYEGLARDVAKLDGLLFSSFFEHLMRKKIQHWDKDVRKLASKSLASLSVINPQRSIEYFPILIEGCVSTQLFLRHGSLLALAELLFSLKNSSNIQIPEEMIQSILEIPAKIEKLRLYRGRGSEQIREAVCFLIESIAKSNIAFHVKLQVSMVEILNDQLRQPHETIQKAASNGLRHMLFVYFSNCYDVQHNYKLIEPTERLQKLTVLKYKEGLMTEENVAATRGYALALGCLPTKLLVLPEGQLDNILDILDKCSNTTKLISGSYDPETCRNCLESSVNIMESLQGTGYLTHSIIKKVFEILFKACRDYSIDQRGDTGSWSRIMGLKGIERVIYTGLREYYSEKEKGGKIGENLAYTCYGWGEIINIFEKENLFSVRVKYPLQSIGDIQCKEQNFYSESNESFSVILPLNYFKEEEKEKITKKLENSKSPILSYEVQQEIFKTILKQLSEKLDVVRETAGQVLLRLLNFAKIYEEFTIPEYYTILTTLREQYEIRQKVDKNENSEKIENMKKTEINEKLEIDDEKVLNSINWTQPNHVYPIMTDLLGSNEYFDAIISGLILSVGGLSGSIIKHSKTALLNSCEKFEKLLGEVFLKRLFLSLLNLFEENKKEDRVILPLIKTVDILVRNGVFDILSSFLKGEYSLQLMGFLSFEFKKCSNVSKLCACLELITLIIAFDQVKARFLAVRFLVQSLTHRYPKVRKYTAELLFLQFSSDLNIVGNSYDNCVKELQNPTASSTSSQCGFLEKEEELEEVMNILTSTSWDSPENDLNYLISQRALLVNLMKLNDVKFGVNMMEIKMEETSKKGKKENKVDELDSYQTLVRDAGY